MNIYSFSKGLEVCSKIVSSKLSSEVSGYNLD